MAFCCEISALSVNFLNTSNLIFSDATIYVGGLDEKVTEALLWEFFLQAGPVGKLLNINSIVDGTVLTLRTGFLNIVNFRQGLTWTLGLSNNFIDGGRPRAKPRLRKVKPHHILKTVFSPRLATVYQVLGYPKSTH